MTFLAIVFILELLQQGEILLFLHIQEPLGQCLRYKFLRSQLMINFDFSFDRGLTLKQLRQEEILLREEHIEFFSCCRHSTKIKLYKCESLSSSVIRFIK